MTEQSPTRNVEYGLRTGSHEPLLPSTRPGLRARRSALPGLVASTLIGGFVLVADQITKSLSERFLVIFPEQSMPLIGDLVRLTYVSNRGAAFGILQDRTMFFVVVGVAVVGVILMSYRYFPITSGAINLAMGLQLGGASGNLIDRVRFGYVVDFIDIGIWPVFNLADAAIVGGVALLAFRLLRSTDARAT